MEQGLGLSSPTSPSVVIASPRPRRLLTWLSSVRACCRSWAQPALPDGADMAAVRNRHLAPGLAQNPISVPEAAARSRRDATAGDDEASPAIPPSASLPLLTLGARWPERIRTPIHARLTSSTRLASFAPPAKKKCHLRLDEARQNFSSLPLPFTAPAASAACCLLPTRKGSRDFLLSRHSPPRPPANQPLASPPPDRSSRTQSVSKTLGQNFLLPGLVKSCPSKKIPPSPSSSHSDGHGPASTASLLLPSTTNASVAEIPPSILSIRPLPWSVLSSLPPPAKAGGRRALIHAFAVANLAFSRRAKSRLPSSGTRARMI